MFEQTFKNIDDILHKDAGCERPVDYVKATYLDDYFLSDWTLEQDKWRPRRN